MVFEDYQVGAEIDGTWTLERLIALGGGGAVYEARDRRTDLRVALKVLRPGNDGSDSRRHQRFLREARIAMRLKSPHAVRLYDVVTRDKAPPYLVMEFLEGETLADRQKRSGPLPVPDAVDWILQAIEPLAEMHAAGIIHRDVKPSNLFLLEGPRGEQTIKLLDFGIVTPDPSLDMDADLTQTDSELGTPLYMAPEQFLNAKYVDARADVWSLGVTLFQLIAGRMPFQAPTVAGLSLRIMYSEPESLLHARPEVPRELAEIIARCLAKEPADRIADVRALGEMLEPFAGRWRARDTDADATVRMPAVSDTSRDAAPEEPDSLEASFETPPPSLAASSFWLRGRALRYGAMIAFVAVWIWMLVVIRRDVAPAPRTTAAPALEEAHAAPREASDAIVELDREPEASPAARALESTAHVTVEPRAAPAAVAPRARPAPRPVPHRAPPRPSASSSTPRPPAPAPDPIDDRIW